MPSTRLQKVGNGLATNHHHHHHFPTQELLICLLSHRPASGLCGCPQRCSWSPSWGPSLLPTLPAGSQDLRP